MKEIVPGPLSATIPAINRSLLGTWFICSTNFPMWLKGDKTNPTFNYSAITKNGNARVLLDEVKYLEKGRIRTLTGFDFPDPAEPDGFIWRGRGLLFFVRSRWKLVLQDPNRHWAVVFFSKTLFTPEGMDIISRTPRLSLPVIEHIRSLLRSDPVLAKQADRLYNLPVPA